jgi:hypothetical protein
MVAAGYVDEDRDNNRDRYEGTTTTAAVAGALAAIRCQKRSGADDMISHRCQQKKCSMEGAQDTPTSTKMECEDLLISSSSAGSFFASVEHFRRGCKWSSRWQVR